MRERPPVGWYLLPRSGQRFYGTIPPGVVALGAHHTEAADGRPRKNARREAWVDYVVSISEGVTADDLCDVDRSGLIELAEQMLKPLEGGDPVDPEVPGTDLVPDPEQVGTGPDTGTTQDVGDDLGHTGDGTA